MVSGIAVCSLGHCHPKITKAIKEQAEKLLHISNLYWNQPQLELAEILTKNSFADKVFFCNSGTEAVEAAIKLARKYGHDTKGENCHEIIALDGSFHGRTMGALSATGQRIYQKGFEPLLPGFTHVPINDINALKLALNKNTVAIILEPIQGEGGVRPLGNEYLLDVRKIADENNAILIFDEIQVGLGRTGALFTYEQTPVIPDILCLAKALGNGLPIGAMLAKDNIMEHFTPGSHASTFGGNPLSCAVAKAVLETINNPEFLLEVQTKSSLLMTKLQEISKNFDIIKEIRGRGLIIGIEFQAPQPELTDYFIKNNILTIISHEKILRLIPPLIINNDQINKFLAVFSAYLKLKT
jgi:predicted acetylornithine/succinylornithine family transaminase